MLPLTQNEFQTLVICSVRYALGRMTYIVSDTAEIVRKHRQYLTPHTISIIKKDILFCIEEHNSSLQSPLFLNNGISPLGSECDAWVWLDLLQELENDKR